MAVPQKRNDYRYTYTDYLAWPDEERWELIDGVPYDMSPAPSRRHQEISVEIIRQVSSFLYQRKCKVFAAPFDIRLSEDDYSNDETIYTVVQPDISVFCDPNRLDDRGGIGAPDICVEILSPATAYKDETEKFRLYQKHGVREYWIVNPDLETVTLYTLEQGEYQNPTVYKKRHKFESTVLEGFELDLAAVFPGQ
ncbi:MAG: Uma2 family endonuclease [Spirochaetota bacterium]